MTTARLTTTLALAILAFLLAWGVSAFLDHALAVTIGGMK
jgi:hypothetical protein